MGKTNFGKLNAQLQETAERKNKQEFKKFDKPVWMKINFGDTNLMVLPPFVEDGDFFNEVYVHHNFNDAEGNKRAYKCSRKAHGSCPICDKAKLLKDAGDGTGSALIAGKKTFLYNVVDTFNNEVKIAPMKPTMHNEIMQEVSAYYSDEGVDATDPSNGVQLKITRLKAQPWARVRVIGKRVEVTSEQIATWLTKIRDLSKIYMDFTPDELTRMLNGESIVKTASNTDDEETEEKTVSPVSVTKSPVVVAVPKPVVVAKTPAPTPTPKTEVVSTGDSELDDILKNL